VHFEREKRLEGRYVSSTTEEDVTALDAVAMYNQLMDVSARTLGHASAGRGRVPYADTATRAGTSDVVTNRIRRLDFSKARRPL
jgi:hypothetical protein